MTHPLPQKPPTWAVIVSSLGLAFTIISFIVPSFGTLIIAPLTSFIVAGGIYGGSRGMGIASFIILIIKYIISPTFWITLFSKDIGGSIFPILGIIGLITIIIAFIKGKRY